ncbi:MAG: N-glycosylase/DNA lyase [Candidatus Altiarchaeia archaeon]
MARPKKRTESKNLAEKIRELKKGEIRKTVDERIKEFESFRNRPDDDLFSELCFCITTANCAAESCIRIQQAVGTGYCSLSREKLSARFKELGYRFPNKRAEYITDARKHIGALAQKIGAGTGEEELRDWLVKNVTGLGYKEASHFLRNVGYGNLAIIDFHILDILAANGLIDEPKTLTKKRYLEIEQVLRDLAEETGVSLSELDLYLWYLETGKVLK